MNHWLIIKDRKTGYINTITGFETIKLRETWIQGHTDARFMASEWFNNNSIYEAYDLFRYPEEVEERINEVEEFIKKVKETNEKQ